MIEDLTKALHDSEFLRRDLLGSLHNAGPVEAIVVQQLIEQAARIQREINLLLSAVEAKK